MEKSKYIFPTINLKETGINLRRIMDKLVALEIPRDRRLYSYYKKINELVAA